MVDDQTSDDQTFHDDIEGYCGELSYPVGAAVGLHVSTRSATFDVRVERWGARREHVWAGPTWLGSSPHHRATPTPTGAAGPDAADPDRRALAQRLLPRDAHRHRRAGRPGRRPRRLRRPRPSRRGGPRACSCSPPTPGTPTTRGAGAACTPAARRCRSAGRSGGACSCRPDVERDDRKARPRRCGEEPDVDGDDLPGVPLRHGLPGLHGLGRLVHVRAPLRRVGRGATASSSTTRSRPTSRRPRRRSTATTSCSASATTSTGRRRPA